MGRLDRGTPADRHGVTSFPCLLAIRFVHEGEGGCDGGKSILPFRARVPKTIADEYKIAIQ